MLSRLKEGIQKVETDLKEDIQKLEADLKENIQKVEADLKEDIQKTQENFMNAIQEVKDNHKRLVSRIFWAVGIIFTGAVAIAVALISTKLWTILVFYLTTLIIESKEH